MPVSLAFKYVKFINSAISRQILIYEAVGAGFDFRQQEFKYFHNIIECLNDFSFNRITVTRINRTPLRIIYRMY